MLLTGLTDWLRESAAYQEVLAHLRQQSIPFNIIRAARPFMLASVAQDWQGAVIYITARGKRAHNVAEQLPVWLGATRRILRYADPTPMFYERLAWDRGVIQARLETLAALMEDGGTASPPIIITSARALMQRTLPVHLFRQQTQLLKPGARQAMTRLVEAWLNIGYEPASLVIEPGTFSRRGGILDIFPLAYDFPVRIEFFGDEIDTLRAFDPTTQRSTQPLQQVSIIPAREALPMLTPPVAHQLAAWFAGQRAETNDEVNSFNNDAEALTQGQSFAALEFYMPYLYAQPTSLLDYAPEDTLIVIDDPDELRDVLAEIAEDAEAIRANNAVTRQLPPDYPEPYLNMAAFDADFDARRLLMMTNLASAHDVVAGDEGSVGTTHESPLPENVSGSGFRLFTPGQRFGGQLRPALSYAREQRNDAAVAIVTAQVERLADIWAQQDATPLPRLETMTEVPASGWLGAFEGTLGEGWTLHTGRGTLHLLTDAEIFNWSRPEPRRRPTSRARRRNPDANYADWKPGEYVVHVDFGIGRFRGLQARTVEGTAREYLAIEYDGTDVLYVPIHQSDRLTRYVGADDAPPRVSKLGKPAEWLKAKERARQAAEEEARELLTIYARRAATKGFTFQPDTPWQHELEASFPYIETDDQLRALREIKNDMESSIPMDRLVCGDVGYGKTEVALRAAFKAVMDGRQVAILVPTTVLADQHYQTFSRRMAEFPLKVELLSRFRTKAEQNAVLKQLGEGQIDIIIGTHRLLSDDVQMKSPGLIIIDEEQRFGVKHKEHFKKLRANIDVLTLTATPIPRTLYLSISGVRDISMIQTPPEDRLPIMTHVGKYDPRLARQAILRELERGGQVFIIHNRVRTIEQVRERFEELVPEANIVIAHGQMSGRQLEHVISAFSQGQYDILLATSIIENGIDMPNVNTLIVDRAEMFGMAQLYQIRGRVGRGAQQGYCYFFHAGRLTEEARARLETLAEHTDLGAGLQIAVRDLELRGAGDILSMRQTGHVTTVGLQLYTQLLQQAVNELKAEMALPVQTASDTKLTPTYLREQIILDLPIAAYIPSDWIPEMALRLQLYRRIGSLQAEADIIELTAELRDRFGELPAAVEGLLYQIRVKLLASTINATAVIKPRQHILIKLPWLAGIDREALAKSLGEDIEVSRTAVELDPQPETWRARLLEVMQTIRAGLPEQDAVGM